MRVNPRDPRVISEGHFVGLKFQEGWWFLQVLSTSYQELKPWILLNENGNRDVIAATSAGNEDEILDEQNRIQLEPNDDERGLVFQILFGLEPSRMRLFPLFGREQNVGLEQIIQAESGEDELWLDGFDSPYNNPASQSEIIYVNDQAPLKIQAYNPMDTAAEARLSIHINKIHYATVTDVNMMKAMLQNQITSKTHNMGLGATGEDQVQMPAWINRSFGEHIRSTKSIFDQGDLSQVRSSSESLNFIDSVNLSGNQG